jgi:hypothetical protein
MSFSSSPFFWSFALEEPGGRLPVLFHRSADGSQSLDAGRRFGLFECCAKFPVGARPFGFAAAEPDPQRFRRDAREIAGGVAVRAEADHGQQALLHRGRKLRRAARRCFVAHVEEQLE